MPNQMSKSDASHIQSTQAQGGKDMSSGGFAARAQGAGDRNSNAGQQGQGGQGGQTQGGQTQGGQTQGGQQGQNK